MSKPAAGASGSDGEKPPPSTPAKNGAAAAVAPFSPNAGDDGDDVDEVFSRLVISAAPRREAQRQNEAVVAVDPHSGPFYVHIDVVYSGGVVLAPTINSYMLRRFYFDPRRYFNFFDEVFAPERPTLADMRRVGSMGKSYYELWKVKANFDFGAFFLMLAEKFPVGGFQVRITALYDGEHQIYTRTY